jgi:uncharacterized protein (TIGR01777 family)
LLFCGNLGDMAVVLITGGTGLVGKALTGTLLTKGHEVIVLSRYPMDKKEKIPRLSYSRWDIGQQQIDPDAIGKADHIIHLAGAGIADKRWTKKRKKEIVDSRVQSSRLLVNSLSAIPNKVKTLISSSAIGWYGPDPVIPNPSPFIETDPSFHDFPGTTCRKWEDSIDGITQPGIRVVKLRTGIVLSREGGALKEFVKPLRFRIAAILGNGRQVISWIHMEDLVNCYIAAMENNKMDGSFNAVAPFPVSNRELVLHLTRCRGKWFLPFKVPSFLLKIILGEMSSEVLKSATVSSDKLTGTGFAFRFPGIKEAITDMLR